MSFPLSLDELFIEGMSHALLRRLLSTDIEKQRARAAFQFDLVSGKSSL